MSSLVPFCRSSRPDPEREGATLLVCILADALGADPETIWILHFQILRRNLEFDFPTGLGIGCESIGAQESAATVCKLRSKHPPFDRKSSLLF